MIHAILAAEEVLASRVAHTLRTYPKHIGAAIGALLLCAGGGAFAVASLGPDASDVPVHQVFEAVQPLAYADQAEVLDNHDFTLFRTELTRASDTIEALLKRLGIADPAAAAFVRGNAEVRGVLFNRTGRTVTAEATRDNTLQRLSARWIPDGDGGFK
ncbi:MAG: M23 family peptidase, partial [Comamonadaceae bacterium]